MIITYTGKGSFKQILLSRSRSPTSAPVRTALKLPKTRAKKKPDLRLPTPYEAGLCRGFLATSTLAYSLSCYASSPRLICGST